MSSWKEQGEGAQWIPLLSHTEAKYNIPQDLLSRMAYQESRFKHEIIFGLETSPKGALGILQLMPEFWSSVQVPIPFSDGVILLQIDQAGFFLSQLHKQFGNWPDALAAYNFGPGNEEKYLEHRIKGLPKETADYVREILADVPLTGERGEAS